MDVANSAPVDAQLAGDCALRDAKLQHLVNGVYAFVSYCAGRDWWFHGFTSVR